MNLRSRSFAQLFAALWYLASMSASHASCDLRSAAQVESVHALPPSLAAILGTSSPGPGGIADRGGPFNRTDVIREPLPMRRFHIAAVTPECVVVAFEQGGRGYSMQIVTFMYVPPDGWSPEQPKVIERLPKSLAELRAAIGR